MLPRGIKIIGLAAPARSGKDTAADYLVHTHRFTKVSFASRLKEGLQAILGVPYDLYTNESKEGVLTVFGKSPRQMMQTLGTEWGRDLIHPDIWVILLKEEILRRFKQDRDCLFVISDVRFENEAHWVRNNGGQVWHIENYKAGRVNPHSSEIKLKYQPYSGDIIINNSITGKHHLYKELDQAWSNTIDTI